MARHTFLGDLASWVIDTGAAETSTNGIAAVHALAVPNQVVTFWDAASGGSQYTDLLDASGNSITTTTSDSTGALAQIQGPDGVTQMWLDAAGGSGPRQVVVATDMLSQGYLPLAGGTMTGELTLAANPVNPLDAATKQYVDSAVPAAGSMTEVTVDNDFTGTYYYRLLADSDLVFFEFHLTSAASVGTYYTLGTVPSAYYPARTQLMICGSYSGSSYLMQITTGGLVQNVSAISSGVDVYGAFVYSLT